MGWAAEARTPCGGTKANSCHVVGAHTDAPTHEPGLGTRCVVGGNGDSVVEHTRARLSLRKPLREARAAQQGRGTPRDEQHIRCLRLRSGHQWRRATRPCELQACGTTRDGAKQRMRDFPEGQKMPSWPTPMNDARSKPRASLRRHPHGPHMYGPPGADLQHQPPTTPRTPPPLLPPPPTTCIPTKLRSAPREPHKLAGDIRPPAERRFDCDALDLQCRHGVGDEAEGEGQEGAEEPVTHDAEHGVGALLVPLRYHPTWVCEGPRPSEGMCRRPMLTKPKLTPICAQRGAFPKWLSRRGFE